MRFKKPVAVAAAVCAGALLLTGCNKPQSGPSSGGATNDINKLVNINPQDRANLDQGGVLRLVVGNIGPNFNTFSNDGNNTDVSFQLGPMDAAGCFTSDAAGNPSPDKNFCLDVKEEVKDGKQTITYKLNPKATWNDGTPIDYKTFVNQWKMLNGQNKEINAVTTVGYDSIESVERGADDKEVIVKMKQVYEPYTDMFWGFMHPAINTAKIFNKDFDGKIHEEWRCGPFKVGNLDMAKKTLTLVPNEKWWGDKPVLDQIVFIEMGAKATLPAFKNGQIDVTGASTFERYKQLNGTKDSEFRRGQRTAVFGYNFNTKYPEIADVNVRKAIFQAVDRKAIMDVRFKGLNWTEPQPGSWALSPMSPYYTDNYPVKDADPEGAKKTLQEAGYTMGSDGFFAKDGKQLKVSVTNFGDDPTINAEVQAFTAQIKKAGINMVIDQRGDSAFGPAMQKRDWGIVAMGYGVGPDATGVMAQFYKSDNPGNMTGCGDKDLDARIDKVPTIVDTKERNAEAMKIEAEWNKKCYAMLATYSGPSIMAINKYLANYGPRMYLSYDWPNIGWMKGHKRS